MPQSFRQRYRRPSWVVVTPASKRDVLRVCSDAKHFASGRGVIAVYEPELGEQSTTPNVIARALSKEHAGRHYALRFANVADDPDHGRDDGEVYEGGKHVGSLKAEPAALLTHFGVRVPNLEPSEPRHDVLEVLPPMRAAAAGEPTAFGRSASEWNYLFERFGGECSLFVEAWGESVARELAPMLASESPEARLAAAQLMAYAGEAGLEPLRAAMAKERDARVLAALGATERSLR